MTVDKATLDYTIANDTQTYGTAAVFATDLGTTIPTGVNGETLDIAYSSTGDTTTASVGSYEITGVVTDGRGLLSNYTVNLTDGTLTVNASGELPTPTVTVADASGAYTSLAFLATGTVTGSGDASLGTPVFTYYAGTYVTPADLDGVTALSGLPVDAGDYTVRASYDGNSDYAAAMTIANFTINKATLDYTIPNDAQTYGTPAVFATDWDDDRHRRQWREPRHHLRQHGRHGHGKRGRLCHHGHGLQRHGLAGQLHAST